jgi:hypothetical protein
MKKINTTQSVTKSRYGVFYFGALLGIVPGILTLSISTISILSANAVIAALQKTAVILIMPGLVGSMIASANVHAFSITIAALINFAIYCLLGAVVFRMALSKKTGRPQIRLFSKTMRRRYPRRHSLQTKASRSIGERRQPDAARTVVSV